MPSTNTTTSYRYLAVSECGKLVTSAVSEKSRTYFALMPCARPPSLEADHVTHADTFYIGM